MKKLKILLASGLLSGSLLGQTYTCHSGGSSLEDAPEGLNCTRNSSSYQNTYRQQQNYIPDANTATKTIKIAIHSWQDGSGGGNYINTPADLAFLQSMVDFINNQFFNANDQPSDPLPGVPFIFDTKIRFSLEGVYFYADDALHGSAWNHLDMNNKALTDHPECIEYLNIHFAGSTTATFGLQSSIGGEHIATSGGGDGSGTGNGNGWVAAQHLSHEIGHALGLCHTWCCDNCKEKVDPTLSDFLSDVFAGPPYSLHQSAWSLDPTLPTNTATNNMMGSTFAAGYFSPLQMGRMHRQLALGNIRNLASGYTAEPLEITSNEEWDFSMKLYRDLVVKSGATLTVKCFVRFVKEARVIVEPGGELILDGGHLTKSEFEDWWGGVYVSGNSSQAQIPSQQGKISILNQGQISYARDGITNIGIEENGGWILGTTGGIIEANNAIFKNNRRDIQLLGYTPPFSKNEKYNATFTDCQFVRDNDYTIESMLQSITLNSVAGVSIVGCTFDNQNTGDLAYHGGAIRAVSATFRVHENSSSVGCTFNGYADAIRCEGNFSIAFPTTIVGATFTNNIHSIYLGSTENPKVAHNSVSTRADHNYVPPANTPFQSGAYGIYLENTGLFSLHDNTLSNPDGTAFLSAGIVIKDNGGTAAQVYHNTIDNYTYGIQAIGNNNDGFNADVGLNFSCNDLGSNNANGTDIIVGSQGGVAGSQGTALKLPNNRFSPGSNIRHFDNFSGNVKYGYGTGDPRVIPVNYTGVTTIPSVLLANYSSNCASRPKPPIVNDHEVTQQDLALIEDQITLDLDIKAELIDQGSTPTLEAQILFASDQSEYQDLYIDLMDMSPYVSDENLLNLISLNDFPELALRNVMVANPHSSRNGEVWDALVAKDPPLSQQTLDDIEGEIQTITAKDVLDMQIANSQTASELISVQLMEYFAEEMSADPAFLDLLKTHLKSRDEVAFRYALVDILLAEGAVSSASQELLAIDVECQLGNREQSEHIFMTQLYTVLNTAITAGHSLAQLPTGLVTDLTGIVNGGSGLAVARARALLELNGVPPSYVEPILNETGSYKTKPSVDIDRVQAPNPAFKLYPNPAGTYTLLQWNWFEAGLNDSKGLTARLTDTRGTLIRSISIDDPQVNSKMISLDQLAPGIHIVHVKQGNNDLYQAKISVVK